MLIIQKKKNLNTFFYKDKCQLGSQLNLKTKQKITQVRFYD